MPNARQLAEADVREFRLYCHEFVVKVYGLPNMTGLTKHAYLVHKELVNPAVAHSCGAPLRRDVRAWRSRSC